MEIDLAAYFTFAIITGITPGPNNISAFSFSMNMGYSKAIKYILGIITGTFVVMLICSFLSGTLLNTMPIIADYMKYAGAAYILWLAFKTLRANYDQKSKIEIAGFGNGLTLQFVNPKAYMYGITVYSTFFAPLSGSYLWLSLSALLICLITFLCVSTWSISGGLIKRFMHNNTIKTIINIVMALALVYTSYKIVSL
ncbi:LysE family transporter [Bacteroidales bacterium]|nr:LysE family transporter [Bacteroidales bacterium]